MEGSLHVSHLKSLPPRRSERFWKLRLDNTAIIAGPTPSLECPAIARNGPRRRPWGVGGGSYPRHRKRLLGPICARPNSRLVCRCGRGGVRVDPCPRCGCCRCRCRCVSARFSTRAHLGWQYFGQTQRLVSRICADRKLARVSARPLRFNDSPFNPFTAARDGLALYTARGDPIPHLGHHPTQEGRRNAGYSRIRSEKQRRMPTLNRNV